MTESQQGARLLRILMQSLVQATELQIDDDIEEGVDQLKMFENEMWSWNTQPSLSDVQGWTTHMAVRILRNAKAINIEWERRQKQFAEEVDEQFKPDLSRVRMINESFTYYTRR